MDQITLGPSELRLGVCDLALNSPTCKSEQVPLCLRYSKVPPCPQNRSKFLSLTAKVPHRHCAPQHTATSPHPLLHHSASFHSLHLPCALSPLNLTHAVPIHSNTCPSLSFFANSDVFFRPYIFKCCLLLEAPSGFPLLIPHLTQILYSLLASSPVDRGPQEGRGLSAWAVTAPGQDGGTPSRCSGHHCFVNECS